MIQQVLLSEQRLSLTQLAHRERIGIATVWRWATDGIRGIRLESFRIGRKKFTTAEAFERFVAATNGGFAVPLKATNKSRQAAIDAADAYVELG